MSDNKQYITHLLRQHKSIFILYFIGGFICYPFVVFAQGMTYMIRTASDPFFYTSYSFSFLAAPFGLVALAIGFGMLTPYLMFNFLFNKSNQDNYFSMPIPRKKLFNLHFMFGWFMQLVPLLINHAIGFVLLKIFEAMLSKNIDKSLYTFPQFLLVTVFLFIGTLILNMPSLIAILCTTNLFNAIIYGAVLHSLPYTINWLWTALDERFFGSYFIDQYTWGRYGTSPGPLANILFHGEFAKSIAFLSDMRIRDDVAERWFGSLFPTIVWFFLAIGLFFVCRQLFKMHKVERTSGSFMIKGFYEVIIFIYGAIIISLALSISQFWNEDVAWIGILTVFLIAFAIYFVVQIIRHHGLPKFFRAVLTYTCIFAVAFGMTFFAKTILPKYRMQKYPNPSDVTMIELTATDPFYSPTESIQNPKIEVDFVEVPNHGRAYLFEKDIVKESNEILAVIELQKEIVEDRVAKIKSGEIGNRVGMDSTYPNFYDQMTYPMVRFVYKNKRGDVLQVRFYTISDSESIEKLEKIVGHTIIRPQREYTRGIE